jgi:hypothetical protein
MFLKLIYIVLIIFLKLYAIMGVCALLISEYLYSILSFSIFVNAFYKVFCVKMAYKYNILSLVS